MEHFLNDVEKITLEDVTDVARRILSSPLTMASYGDGKSNRKINFHSKFMIKIFIETLSF